MLRNLLRRLLRALLWFAAVSIVLVLVFRWVPPPGTALMLERKVQSWVSGEPIDLQREWVSWDHISDDLKVAVIAGEDQKFASHWGFDIPAIQAALAFNERGGNVRGASTLTQQVAKNLFLWPGRSWLRKGLEAWFTGLMELFWTKQRILEVYLNSAEWGQGYSVPRQPLAITLAWKPVNSAGSKPHNWPPCCPAPQVECWQAKHLRGQPRGLDSPPDEPAGRAQLPDATGHITQAMSLSPHTEQA